MCPRSRMNYYSQQHEAHILTLSAMSCYLLLCILMFSKQSISISSSEEAELCTLLSPQHENVSAKHLYRNWTWWVSAQWHWSRVKVCSRRTNTELSSLLHTAVSHFFKDMFNITQHRRSYGLSAPDWYVEFTDICCFCGARVWIWSKMWKVNKKSEEQQQLHSAAVWLTPHCYFHHDDNHTFFTNWARWNNLYLFS